MKLEKILILLCLFFLFGCDKEDSIVSNSKNTTLWNFENLNGWEDASQNMNGAINYTLQNNNLRFFTNANTYQRPKVKTSSKFEKGNYTWRVYIPSIIAGEQVSIGAFLYHDDNHELDFEIGYGTTQVRNQVNAQPNDLVVYMTSQNFPYHSVIKKIERENWYNFTIELDQEVNGNYNATWKINGINQTSLVLNYNATFDFSIFCSLENLQFMGNQIPQNQNYTLFDYVKFEN